MWGFWRKPKHEDARIRRMAKVIIENPDMYLISERRGTVHLNMSSPRVGRKLREAIMRFKTPVKDTHDA